jgi:hypothetical protein
MLAVFLGEATRPFREGVPPLLATPWRVAMASDETPAAERRNLLATAAAVVATHYGADLPPASALRLLQVPGAGYDGVDLGAVPASAAVCNVFEHEPAVAEFALLAMLEWCHRLGRSDAAVRAGDWSGSPRFGAPPHEELHGKTLAVVGLGRIGAGGGRLRRRVRDAGGRGQPDGAPARTGRGRRCTASIGCARRWRMPTSWWSPARSRPRRRA